MIILGIDVETDHYDPQIARVTEVGLALFDTDEHQFISMESWLVKEVGAAPLSDDIIEITGITQKMVDVYGESSEFVISRVLNYVSRADVVLAHNGNLFDRPLMRAWMGRYLTDEQKLSLRPKHWIDSLTDLDYPKFCSHRSMTYLQGFYGIMNPFKHRALTDILTTMTIIDKNFDWADVLKISHSRTIRFIAQVDYQDRELAKMQKFKWDAPRKMWHFDAKEILAARKLMAANFNFSFGAVYLGENNVHECIGESVYKCLCDRCEKQRELQRRELYART